MSGGADDAAAGSSREVLVWDPWVRLTHWGLAMLVAGAWLTRELEGDWFVWHTRLGYAVLVLVVTRILWGFVGSKHARFADFIRGPRAIIAYIKAVSCERPSGHKLLCQNPLGHNPLGALMIIAFLVLLLVQALTGLFANDQVFETGPLFGYIAIETSDRLTTLHKQIFDWIMAAIGVHVAAALFYLWIKRENLILPMITGRKRIDGASMADSATNLPPQASTAMGSWWLAVFIAALVAGALAWVVLTAPEAGLYTF
ncbi:MAG: cytochrome B [Gammaproteobacteria bacterium]|nr:cytochrome B [Gammaproteobacteria bacterium]